MNIKSLLRWLILLLVRISGAPASNRSKRRIHATPPGKPRILVMRPDHLGDLVLVTPTLDALRAQAPDAHITMLVGPWSREVVARHPALDAILTCPFPGFQRATQQPLAPYILLFQMARQLKRAHYDLAINLRPDFWWGAALIYLAGISHRVGYAIQPGTPFLNHTTLFPATPEHATTSNLRLTSVSLQALGYPALDEPYTPARYPLRFEPTEEERQWVDAQLAEAGIMVTTPVVVIHPGTGAAVKLWRNLAWSHCANTLTGTEATRQHQRLQIVLTGSKSERPMLAEIALGMQTAPLLLSEMTVGQLAAVMGRALIVLGVDSGPLHLAAAQGTHTLQLFGPTDDRIFGPWSMPEQHTIISATQKCPGCPAIPCGRLDFGPEAVRQHPCVRLIPEELIAEKIVSLLVKSGRKKR